MAADVDAFELRQAGIGDDLQGLTGRIGEEMEVESAHRFEAHPSVIARSEATKQSRTSEAALDCFASLAMTEEVMPSFLSWSACG
jgi:hypothetical protein